MPVNRRRGEIGARLDGRDYRLVLTLGALAELEDAFQVEDLSALARRFSAGRLRARDIIRVLHAGLRGGGVDLSVDEVGRMSADGGVAEQASIVAELLTATFGTDASPAKGGPANP